MEKEWGWQCFYSLYGYVFLLASLAYLVNCGWYSGLDMYHAVAANYSTGTFLESRVNILPNKFGLAFILTSPGIFILACENWRYTQPLSISSIQVPMFDLTSRSPLSHSRGHLLYYRYRVSPIGLISIEIVSAVAIYATVHQNPATKSTESWDRTKRSNFILSPLVFGMYSDQCQAWVACNCKWGG